MNQIIIYIVAIVVSLFIIVFANKHLDNKCRETGGQIITNSTSLNHSCIRPAGK